MADAVVGSLVYKFEADTTALKNALAEAKNGLSSMSSGAASMGREASAAAQAVGRSFKDMADKVAEAAYQLGPWTGQHVDMARTAVVGLQGAVGTAGVAIAGAAAGIVVAIGGIALAGNRALEKLTELNDVIQKTGMSATQFRGLELLGARNGLTSDQTKSAAETAGTAFEQYKRNAGSVKETIDNIDSSFVKVLDKTRTFQEFWDTVVAKARQLPAEEGMDLTKALLGDDAGQKLYDAIMRGEMAMRNVGNAARDAGTDLDQGLAAKAADLQRQVDAAAEAARTKLTDAFNSLAPIVADIKNDFYSMVSAMADLVKEAQKLPGPLQTAANALGKLLMPGGAFSMASDLGKYLERNVSEPGYRWLRGIDGKKIYDEPAGPYLEDKGRDLGRGKFGPYMPPPVGDARDRYNKRANAGARGGASSGPDIDGVQRYVESLRDAKAMAEAELSAWGKGNVERAKALDLARAEAIALREGKTLTEEQRNAIVDAATATQGFKDKLEDLKQKQQDLNNAARQWADTFANALDDLLVQGRKFGDVMKNMLKQLESQLLKMALLGGDGKGGIFGNLFGGLLGGGGKGEGGGGGFLSSIFGGLFGGAHAVGGDIQAGKIGLVGENGPELISGPASITPLSQARGGSQGVTVHNYAAGVDVKPQITPQGVAIMIRSAIEANNAQLPSLYDTAMKRS